ncbi:protein SCO1 homolog 2, mitochondrial [Malania oleifera]|uniref:protein SCO1 homolog 2, mitochondrial n=1 Tax=Malania oleifera TaxID=397392 RepID=UPI0025AEAA6D|nr:protein SCO1 homolog 2, mitochondrial [Malania oleifera]
MPVSRVLFFASKGRSGDAFNLIQRFGPSKRFQYCSYANKSRYNNGRPTSDTVIPVKTRVSRSWSNYIVPTGLLGIVGAAVLVHKNDERRAILKGQGNNVEGNTCKGPIIGGPFTLINSNYQLVTEKNLLGNWVILYFGYTSSPSVGPGQLQIMAKAIDILESKQNFKLLPVFVTIDPQRDSPLQLRAYVKEFDPRIVGLTGPVTAIRQMAQEYRVYFKKVEEDGDDYLIESSDKMYLLNPSMEVVGCFGVEYSAEELSEAILKELRRT